MYGAIIGWKYFEMVSKPILMFLINFGAHLNIVFIIKQRFSRLYRFPQLYWLLLPRMVIISWACNPISFKHFTFWHMFLEPIHIPLKYRCQIKRNNQVRHIYLNVGTTWKVVSHCDWGLNCTKPVVNSKCQNNIRNKQHFLSTLGTLNFLPEIGCITTLKLLMSVFVIGLK